MNHSPVDYLLHGHTWNEVNFHDKEHGASIYWECSVCKARIRWYVSMKGCNHRQEYISNLNKLFTEFYTSRPFKEFEIEQFLKWFITRY
jgi:hypothetical protein